MVNTKAYNKFLFTVLIAANFFFAKVTSLYAQTDVLSDRLDNVQTATEAPTFVNAVVNVAIPAGLLCLIGLCIYGGYQLMTSQGDPEALNEAKDIIVNAILGFVLIAMSVGILMVMRDVLDISTA